MTMVLKTIITIITGYFLGSIPAGYIAGRIKKVNITQHGFKKIGASNVYKTFGMLPAIIVFFADFIKGILAVLIGKWFGLPESIAAFAGASAIIGHNWPIWLKFKGEGRGVATSIGLLYYFLTKEILILLAPVAIFSYILKTTALPVFGSFFILPLLSLLLKEQLWLVNFSALIFLLLVIGRLSGLIKVQAGKRKTSFFNALLGDRQKTD